MSSNHIDPNASKEAREAAERQQAAGSFTNESQHFSMIKSIFARDGFVFISVYPEAQVDRGDVDKALMSEEERAAYMKKGGKLKDSMLTIRDAAARACALNAMAHKFPPKDKAVAMDIVDNVIAACEEAKIQAKKEKQLIVPAHG